MRRVFFIFSVLAISFNFYQCSSSKYVLEKESPLKPYKPYFQAWFEDIKNGGSGINICFPNLNGNNEVIMDSIYFRGIKGKLVKGRSKYVAQLHNPSPYDRDMSVEAAFKKEEKPTFPFKLLNTECVISYLENGERKYLKISNLIEKEGIYYEKGLAAQEIEDEDN